MFFLDANEFRNLVVWLEDQKIRHYKIEDRKALRDISSSEWPKTFQQYRDDLACPIQSEKDGEVLEWLLAFAVRLEYADNGK
jgi:RLL motif-containing protein 1